MMTMEKERYIGVVSRRAKNSLVSETVIAFGMISAALILLDVMI